MKLRSFPQPNLWCLHSYYTLCPYAPDGSGRILIAGADLERGTAGLLVLSPDGEVLNRIGRQVPQSSFWHTAFWQSWSPDAQSVYYQGGTDGEPRIVRHHLATGSEESRSGEIEGLPPSGEPIFSCLHRMLYAAGYGDGRYKPEASPMPFASRDRHGIFRISVDRPGHELALSTAQILDAHPRREEILRADREVKERLGASTGLTLMTYCVRWNSAGTRCLFFFGNHCVARERKEPRIASVFTADRAVGDFRLAVDLSFDRTGVHWGWQANGEQLIGYGPHPEDPARLCLAEVNADGSGYRFLSAHHSGGHPSTSPADPDLIVTDENVPGGGAVVFLSKKTGHETGRLPLPKFAGAQEPPGRNPLRVCHHPVFNHDGTRILCNSLPGKHAELVEIHP